MKAEGLALTPVGSVSEALAVLAAAVGSKGKASVPAAARPEAGPQSERGAAIPR
jgi:hypothetical protein